MHHSLIAPSQPAPIHHSRHEGRLAASAALIRRVGHSLSAPLRRKTSPLAAAEFRALFETLPIPIVVTGAEHGQILFANARARDEFSIPMQISTPDRGSMAPDAIYRDHGDALRVADIVARHGVVENFLAELKGNTTFARWALVNARQITISGVDAIASSFVDVTDRRATEEALLNSEVRYALISRASNDGIWDWDLTTGNVYYSARWRDIAGVPAGVRLNSFDDWLGLVHPEDHDCLRDAVDNHLAGRTTQLDIEYRIQSEMRGDCWMHCRGIVLRGKDAAPIRMAGSQSDITLRRSYESDLRNAAYEDHLTGLANRASFNNLIEVKKDAASICGGAILLLNTDQFKRINENLGIAAGDAALVTLANRLAKHRRRGDCMARLAADEFAVYFDAIEGSADARRRSEAILADLAEPIMLGDAQISLGISAGLSSADSGGAENGADMMHHAGLALDRSKQLGGAQYTVFDDDLLHENKLRQRLSHDLASAGRLGQISLDYQPIVSLAAESSHQVVGFEALMRWRHPQLGPIEPARFVPLAEDAGLIGSLGLLAIEHAVTAMNRWIDAGLASARLSIAVNLSVRQISDVLGIRRLYALLDRLAVPQGSLKLEITESVLMSDPDEMVKVLSELRGRGIGLSLDDFGTGYSSLSYLHRFPLDVLKVDRSFTAQMLRSPEAMRLVRSIIDLSHDLGLSVVAEGVECIEEFECLRDMGCDYAQGYYFSRPVPGPIAERLLVDGVNGVKPLIAA